MSSDETIPPRSRRRRHPPLTQSSYRARLNPESTIQSADVATLPKPGTSAPSSIKFHITGGTGATAAAADDDDDEKEVWVTYLLPSDATSLTRQLYATRVAPPSSGTGATTLELFQPTGRSGGTEADYSPEEKLRRERARMMATGVTSYAWASDDKAAKTKMLIPFGGALYLLDDPLGGDFGGGEGECAAPRKIVETKTAPSEGTTTDSEDGDDDNFDALPIGAPLLDAKISADGSTVAFVAGDEVYVMPTTAAAEDATTPPRRVTRGARGVEGKTNGVADYLAQEELERADGFWLSPRGTRVAYEEVDESHIPPYRIVHQGEDRGLAPTFVEGQSQAEVETDAKVTCEETRYPFAGGRNPVVKFGVADAATEDGGSNKEDGENVVWFDLIKVFGEDFYLAKVEWLDPPADDDDDEDAGGGGADSTKLVVQLLNRRQTELALLLLDCDTGDITTLHVEKAEKGGWVNLNSAFRPLPVPDDDSDSFRFLWASERDGYRHLYILESHLADGGFVNMYGAKVVRRLTGPGEYICEEVVGLDKENGHVYYMGTDENRWLERHLFRVSMENEDEEPTCLTGSVPGQHMCVLNIEAGLFVDTVSSTTQAPLVKVCEIPSTKRPEEDSVLQEIHQLHDAAAVDPRVARYGSDALKPPTFHTFPSTDGQVTLQGAMYLPDEELHGKGPYPLVVATYGGPHVQYVQNTWGMTVDMRSQFLRSNGFAVLKVDNRGSNRRGLVFETPVYGNMGELEVADQVAGVKWAVENGIADAERIAVSGWSYGGYMALKCLTDRPDVFHAAVSGAPVTDWALYDTAYTERYMGLPQENPEGYAKASALTKVADIQGSLLLCHGLLDENVLFRQSAVLVNALIEQQKAYDLALFPSERHGPRRQQDRAFLEERILAFLQRSLGV